MKKVLIVFADGCEEIEAVAPVDILRRAGMAVTVAGLSTKTVTTARGLRIETDLLLCDATENYDMIILPGGGKGAENLAASSLLRERILTLYRAQKWIAAICASPAVVLAPLGILDGKTVTCYPETNKSLGDKIHYSKQKVVVDRNVITAQGPAVAIAFSLRIVQELCGFESSQSLARALLAE